MKYVGDINKLKGMELEPVWCITGGSPCQDLSFAGKRAGLAGDRSVLFLEQIRITKEMRESDKRSGRADDMVRPRYLVWENVAGAYSSNFGYDFKSVLEEICRVAEAGASVPEPKKRDGKLKWARAGYIEGDEWSVAWRTHDAKYWGVPQRRRRISVVADFGGYTAGEILFERTKVPGHTESSEARGGGAAGASKVGANGYDRVSGLRIEKQTDKPTIAYGFSPNQSMKMFGIGYQEEVTPTLDTGGGVAIAYQIKSDDIENRNMRWMARRATPIECERLQAYPDGWTDIGEWVDSKGKIHKQADAQRYKALGNSIALPFWLWMFRNMAKYLPERATLGSLFDGIGGFPLCWEQIHGKGTARWASEIEEFPMAVTRIRFEEERR